MVQAARTRGDARAARIEKARQCRLSLEKDGEAKNARVDAAVADVYLAQEERDAALAAVEQADVTMSRAVARVLAEGVPLATAAELTGLAVTQVQRLKAAAVSAQSPADAPSRVEPAAGAAAVA